MIITHTVAMKSENDDSDGEYVINSINPTYLHGK